MKINGRKLIDKNESHFSPFVIFILVFWLLRCITESLHNTLCYIKYVRFLWKHVNSWKTTLRTNAFERNVQFRGRHIMSMFILSSAIAWKNSSVFAIFVAIFLSNSYIFVSHIACNRHQNIFETLFTCIFCISSIPLSRY